MSSSVELLFILPKVRVLAIGLPNSLGDMRFSHTWFLVFAIIVHISRHAVLFRWATQPKESMINIGLFTFEFNQVITRASVHIRRMVDV